MALRLAAKARGRTSPNQMVGAVTARIAYNPFLFVKAKLIDID